MNKMEIVKALLLDETKTGTGTGTEFPYRVGDTVFLRTVTLYYLGRIKEITDKFVILEDCSWVQDTGIRLGEFIKNGPKSGSSEIEPIGINAVQIANVIDCISWGHALPKEAY